MGSVMRGYTGPYLTEYEDRFLANIEERDGHMIWKGPYHGSSPVMRLKPGLYNKSGIYLAVNLAWLFLGDGWLPERNTLRRIPRQCDELRCIAPWHFELADPIGYFFSHTEWGDEVPWLDSRCKIWTAHLDPDGYGQFNTGGKTHLAHRWIYEQLGDPIPEGWQLHHLCGNRHCVLPSHLEAMPRSRHLEAERELRRVRSQFVVAG